MQVGLKLFGNDNKVVYEAAEVPKSVSNASLVMHKGSYYRYNTICSGRGEPYARFEQCDAPVELT